MVGRPIIRSQDKSITGGVELKVSTYFIICISSVIENVSNCKEQTSNYFSYCNSSPAATDIRFNWNFIKFPLIESLTNVKIVVQNYQQLKRCCRDDENVYIYVKRQEETRASWKWKNVDGKTIVQYKWSEIFSWSCNLIEIVNIVKSSLDELGEKTSSYVQSCEMDPRTESIEKNWEAFTSK